MTSIRVFCVLASMTASLIGGCGGSGPNPPTASNVSSTEKETGAGTSKRDVTLQVPVSSKSGSKLTGKAVFTEVPEGVRVVIDVTGLSPGNHATHVHEKGDCSATDATSAGDHFNPDGHQHGLPSSATRHVGDLGNIVVGENGTGHHEVTSPGANLRPNDPRSFLSRAIIVHDKVDDGGQPSGNAGGRIGCGEIRR
jgi:superoxide dismutase, Cu-Zn family